MIDYVAVTTGMKRRAERAMRWAAESRREYGKRDDYANQVTRTSAADKALDWAEQVAIYVAPLPSHDALARMTEEKEHKTPTPREALGFVRHNLTNYEALLEMSEAYECHPDDRPRMRETIQARVNAAIVVQVPAFRT